MSIDKQPTWVIKYAPKHPEDPYEQVTEPYLGPDPRENFLDRMKDLYFVRGPFTLQRTDGVETIVVMWHLGSLSIAYTAA